MERQKGGGRFNNHQKMAKVSEAKNDPFPQLGNAYGRSSSFGQPLPTRNVPTNSAPAWNTICSAPTAWERPNLMPKHKETIVVNKYDDDDDNDDNDVVYGSSEDEDFSDDDLEFEATDEKSHERNKRNKRFKAFFDDIDTYDNDTLSSGSRRWHCPACKGGPGGIDWYRGLAPLIHHAVTIKSRRVKLHRLFVAVLNEESRRRRLSIAPDDIPTGRWEGLKESVKDHQIVWPPMVVIVNTKCQQMDNGKWNGMGNQELLDHFQQFAARKARHSYGPNGHRGISILIFDHSAAGYFEAERLDKHFKAEGRGKDAWFSNKVPCFITGKRQLCGYMALEEDMNDFNLHCQGMKSKLKFEMRSYQEMVESQINKMNENLQCKDKYAKSQRHVQILSETVVSLSQKLHITSASNRELRKRTVSLLQQNKEELDSQEEFFKEKLKAIHQAIDAKEENFEKLQQERWDKVEQPNASLSSRNDSRCEERASLMKKLQEKEMEEFEVARKNLISSHEDKKGLVMKRYREELLELEKEFENEISQLMENYNKHHSAAKTSNNN
ncbi:Protein SUPPRESSOR OF GENE SILENCING 3 [Euphorbia peplus]|nr:Protein SUPPRESSOR OF GENE SILENCING 3 [Euphorbia peplus]